MSKHSFESYIGQTNNHLTVIGISKNRGKRGRQLLLCQCDCGNTVEVLPYQFKNGAVKSCGCAHAIASTTHGLSKTNLYAEWVTMKQRCYNPNNGKYKNYGARGITVCDEWKNSFESFLQWVESTGGKPEGMSIDRIDNNGPYCPENCRWATPQQQMRNTRVTLYVTVNGVKKAFLDWCDICNISYNEGYRKIYKHHMNPDDVFKT